MPGVRSWGRKWMITTGGSKEMTHLLLDGGKLSVSPEDEKTFLTKVASDISRGVKNYIVELRTPIYKFHADIDVFEEKPKDYSEIKKWIIEMLSILRDFYPKIYNQKIELSDKIYVDKLTTIVCTTDIKLNAQKYGKSYSKVGVHIILPWLEVDTESSLRLRSAFIQRFYEKYGARPENTNEWEDVFDHTVYTQNGLRMVGCAKIDRCSNCKPPFKFVKGKPNKCPINKCNGWGKIDVGRIYKVSDVLSSDGTDNKEALQELIDDELLMTRTTSIKLSSESPDLQEIPEWFDPNFQIEVGKDTLENKRMIIKPLIPKRCAIKTLENNELNILHDSNNFNLKSLDNESTRAKVSDVDNRKQLIIDWFRDETYLDWFLIPEVYRDINIEDVVLNVPKLGERYYTIKVDSRYCQNIQREHYSNGIYFVLNRSGLYQKCFCKCNTTSERVSGKRCCEYHSPRVQIPQKIKDVLFPYSDEIRASQNQFFHEGPGKYIGMSTKDKVRLRLRQYQKK